MSFGPPRFLTPTKNSNHALSSSSFKTTQTKSPPRMSAEVAAKFDANIRSFDPSRKKSPKDYLRRKLPVSLSPTKQRADNDNNNKTSPVSFFAFPHQNDGNNNNNNTKTNIFTNDYHNNKPKSLNLLPRRKSSPNSGRGSVLFGESSNRRKSSSSPAAAERQPKRIFEDFNLSSSELKRTNSNSSHQVSFADDNTRSKNASIPFYKHSEVSSEWIRVHAKMTETLHVEGLLRKRLQNLELEHIKAIIKFMSEFTV